MSTHQNLGSLFEEVVEEYLAIAKMSIDGRKADNGFYGYPATLLLFCIVDSIGQNLVREEKNKIPHNDVNFYMLNHKIFGLNLSKDQLEILGNFYRHKLAHNAIIAKGAFLSPKENDTPFAFAEHGQLRTIFVRPFFQRVENAWNHRNKESFIPSERNMEQNIPPLSQVLNQIVDIRHNAVSGTTTTYTAPASGVVYID